MAAIGGQFTDFSCTCNGSITNMTTEGEEEHALSLVYRYLQPCSNARYIIIINIMLSRIQLAIGRAHILAEPYYFLL